MINLLSSAVAPPQTTPQAGIMTRTKRRTSASEFNAVRPFLKISDDRIAAAYMALVEGRTLQEVATRFVCTRQAVNDSIGVVWKVLEQYYEVRRAMSTPTILLPPGWEQVTLIAPRHLIDKFRAEISAVANADTSEKNNEK